MNTITHVLKSGIELTDCRQFGMGIRVNNPETNFGFLSYTSELGFYINLGSQWITEKEWPLFYERLDSLRLSLVEANRYLKSTK